MELFAWGTALSFYQLSTWDPPEINIAIYREKKITLPVYPPIKLYHFSGIFYKTGITEIQIEDKKIRIYNKKKTICDILRHRNKIGMDIMKEILGEYLKSKDTNLNKLNEYAQKLKISSVLNKYMDVLL